MNNLHSFDSQSLLNCQRTQVRAATHIGDGTDNPNASSGRIDDHRPSDTGGRCQSIFETTEAGTFGQRALNSTISICVSAFEAAGTAISRGALASEGETATKAGTAE